jgi:hypothetical protein
MKLDDLERRGDKNHRRFVTHVQDVSGDEKFELTIAGPDALVRDVLADATIELTIDSAQSQDELARALEERHPQQRKAMWSLAGLDDVDSLFKPEPPRPQRETSVLAAVRPVGGEGTPFAFSFSTFAVPGGTSVFFFGSFVGFTFGSLLPASGDQDLFLHLFATTGPVVSASVFPFTSPDVVSFALPFPFFFVPVFQVFGFATGVCSSFSAFGV